MLKLPEGSFFCSYLKKECDMSERFNVYTHPGVPQCRRCLLEDFCGVVPKRLAEVVSDMGEGNAEELQCGECTLGQVEFHDFVAALYIGAMLGDEMGDV